MSTLSIVVIVLSVLLLYIRFRINSKSVIDKALNFGLVLLLIQIVHTCLINTYLPFNLYLISLAPYSLLYPPLIYYIVQFSHRNYMEQLKNTYRYHLIPFVFFTIIYFVLLFSEAMLEAYGSFTFQLLLIVEIVSSLSYAIWCIIILYKSYKETWLPQMRLLSEAFVLFLVLFGCFLMVQLYEQIKDQEDVVMSNRHFSLILILISILSIFIITIEKLIRKSAIASKGTELIYSKKQIDLEEKPSGVHSASQSKSDNFDIESCELLEKLTALVEDYWFMNPEINLSRLAKETNTNAAFISKVLNQELGINFNQYINGIRIEYVVSMVKDKVDKDEDIPSVEDLFLAAGFTSKSTFNRHFKRILTQTPTEYIESFYKK